MMRAPRLTTFGLGASAVLTLLLAVLIGFVLFFPVASLRPRLEQEASKRGLRLTIGELASSFPAGLQARRVVLAGAGDGVSLAIDRLELSPDWSQLLTGHLAIDIEARLLGGEIEGSVARDGHFALHGADLTWRGPLPGGVGGTLSTHLRSAALSGVFPAKAGEAAALSLECDQAAIEGLLGARTPLNLGTIVLRGEGQGKELRLTTIEASGGQLSASGSGSLLLSEPLGRSPLNLTLALRSNPGLDPTLAELLIALLPPAADGTSRLRLTGTLAAPRKSEGTN